MKKTILTLLITLSTNLFAHEAPKITVKEIKEFLQTINPETTCLDEYVRRRKQLMVKLSLAPVTMTAGFYGSAYAGMAAGAGVALVVSPGGWDALGYMIGGAVIGVAAGSAATVADTTATALTLKNMTLVMRALAENHLDRTGEKSELLYKKYVKRSKSTISKEEFIALLMKADATNALCDGSMVKQPKVKLGSKLKFKVAKLKDIVRELE